MTNAEKFKTADERYTAFKKFCSTHRCGTYNDGKPKCPLYENEIADGANCKFYWLELNYEEPEPELKPCPFCGREPRIVMFSETEMGGSYETYAVQCWACEALSSKMPTKLSAIARWNRRAE